MDGEIRGGFDRASRRYGYDNSPRKCRANGCDSGKVNCNRCDISGFIDCPKCEGTGFTDIALMLASNAKAQVNFYVESVRDQVSLTVNDVVALATNTTKFWLECIFNTLANFFDIITITTNKMRTPDELSDREKRVVEERIGIKGKPKSREQVCEMFAISEDRLRQLEEKAKNLLSK